MTKKNKISMKDFENLIKDPKTNWEILFGQMMETMAFVDEKGNVDKVKIIKGLGGGCDEEVERVLTISKFKPWQHEGKPVKVKTTISVAFKIK